jgi:hypothetical protein
LYYFIIPNIVISPNLPNFVVETILSVIAIRVIMIEYRRFHSFPTLYLYLREGISHVCLTISPKGELVMYKNKGQRLAFKTKGRPTLEEREVLDCSKKLRVELSKLKREMCFEKGTEMLIALSISSDQMLRHVHMFPETWFMDVTANLNKLKRDVFVMVVRDACGKCYVGNFTVIPSGQSWVFMKIYETFFYHLFGPVTIGRNRLAITDEDSAEFQPFQNLIDTNTMYSQSRHMLCIFHAIVQQFHVRIYPLLPARNTSGKRKITKLGKKYCVVLYRWLQQQSTYVETKKEYDKSYKLLNEFLNRPRTINDLTKECIKAIRLFQDHIRTRENKLGNHMRMDIRNCNEACTSSPAESMNSTFKGGTSKVNSNMNLDTSTQHITKGINTRSVITILSKIVIVRHYDPILSFFEHMI